MERKHIVVDDDDDLASDSVVVFGGEGKTTPSWSPPPKSLALLAFRLPSRRASPIFGAADDIDKT